MLTSMSHCLSTGVCFVHVVDALLLLLLFGLCFVRASICVHMDVCVSVCACMSVCLSVLLLVCCFAVAVVCFCFECACLLFACL